MDLLGYELVDQVAVLTLNRPDEMNALNIPLKEALVSAVAQAGQDPGVRCVVLTGTGRAFCVGQDLKEHLTRYRAGEQLMDTVHQHYNVFARGLAEMDKPVLAAVNGVAAGAGLSLCLAADLRIADRGAGFNTSFAGVALSADTGATYWLPRLVGPAKAKELLYFPRTVPAEDALAMGLVNEVVDDGTALTRTMELARTLAAGPTVAYSCLRKAVGYAMEHDLAQSLAKEAEYMELTGGTADHGEAVSAFLEKRKPVFEGR